MATRSAWRPPPTPSLIDAVLEIPPFTLRLRSPFASVAQHVQAFYGDARVTDGHARFIDFDLQVLPGRLHRRLWRPQARFLLDGVEPFHPLPAAQAAPMLEWGLNWCVAQRAMGYLVMHAAVVARGDAAIMMPGMPGAGKSTLCASLVHLDGWRLLSDELAILDPADGLLRPHPRPISLKNHSLPIVQAMPGARLGPIYTDTRKGTIGHAAAPAPAWAEATRPAAVRWVLFPRFEAGAAAAAEEIGRAEAFALISEQSFNRERMGEPGFDALCALLDGARCFEIRHGDTDGGLRLVRQLCQP